jgi:DeoR/GlpR family transcriptional regulator of sugar metabolism
MTVRRDLAQLQREGRLRRVHGGAMALGARAGTSSGQPTRPRRPGPDVPPSAASAAPGEALAAAAVGHVTPGSCIGLAAGHLAPALARALTEVADLVVVTNSLPAAEVLERAAGVSVILTGGVRTGSGALVGPVAVAALASLHLGEVLLPASAVDARAGITAETLLEAEFQRAMMRAASHVRVVVPSHRVGSVALCAVAPASAAQVVVTDADGSTSAAVGSLSRVVAEVVTVPGPGPRRRTA